MRFFCSLILAVWPVWVGATSDARIEAVLDSHVLPRATHLATTAAGLNVAANMDCDPQSKALQDAFHTTFDAWIGVSHLRFGPLETDHRGFALAFWPDTRGVTPKTLATLIAEEDPAVMTPDRFAEVSVAARGLYALEYLLFDERFLALGTPGYRCALIRAIAADVARVSDELATDWRASHADLMRVPGPGQPYETNEDVLQAFFKSLNAGLEINSDLRLGRPIGQAGRPRPTRAESWRSGRSQHNLVLSLSALKQLADLLAKDDPFTKDALNAAFDRAIERANDLDDPVFAGVDDPVGRLRLEALQQQINDIQRIVAQDLGPALGVAAGFNALDGD